MNSLESTRQAVSDLLVATGKAHHLAFEATDGEDPEWPIWYAGHLQQPLGKLLGTEFTRSRLVYCLMDAEYERAVRAEEAEWAPYYAKHFAERFAQAQAPLRDKILQIPDIQLDPQECRSGCRCPLEGSLDDLYISNAG